jgi:hypothetical protein
VRSRRGFSPWLSHPRAGMCRSAPTRTGISWPSEWTRRGQPIRSSSSSRGEIRVASKAGLPTCHAMASVGEGHGASGPGRQQWEAGGTRYVRSAPAAVLGVQDMTGA